MSPVKSSTGKNGLVLGRQLTKTKLLSLLLAGFLVVALLTGCNNSETKQTTGQTTGSNQTSTADTTNESAETTPSNSDDTDHTNDPVETSDAEETDDQSNETDDPDSTDEPDETEPADEPAPTPALPADDISDSFFGPVPVPAEVSAFEHLELKAIYIGAAANVDQALEIAKKTEVNAVVIDLKESDGIKYASKVPLAVETGLVKPAFDLADVIARFHAEDVKVIGRIVCFKDPLLAEARPDLAIQDENGRQLFFSNEGGKPFVNPYNQTVWQFNIDLALEAITYGIDEIQYDYVRFPTGGTTSGSKPYFGPEGQVPSRVQAINRFLQVSAVHIQQENGVPLGADVFAIIITSELDGNNLGQDWKTVGLTGIDNVAPMIYPSHYANSSTTHYSGNGVGSMINGVHFEKPDLQPYHVMHQALLAGRTAADQSGYAVNRPYLQAFTAAYLPNGYYIEYRAEEISAQIKAIYDAGYAEWICWNPRAEYPISAFAPES